MNEEINSVHKGISAWKIATIVLAVLLALLFVWSLSLKNLAEDKIVLEQAPEKVDLILSFLEDFVVLVLNTDGNVDLENRLKLENAVRKIDDQEIFDAWHVLVNSEIEADAQEAVLDLLELLVKKARNPI